MPSQRELLAQRTAARAGLDEKFVQIAHRAAVQAGKSRACREENHAPACPGMFRTSGRECLCPCHDPQPTHWVWWAPNDDDMLIPLGTATGLFDSQDDAIDHGLSRDISLAAWIREQLLVGFDRVEQVSAERLAALANWDAKPEHEKAALRPEHGAEGQA